ncbi:hypothetical protein llg_15720 [Luteolibacter sp. LG18]|nr:hypothetical protein llg_15720 [Luteolibacter sp. LG18]
MNPAGVVVFTSCTPMNPYDVIWSVGIALVGLLVAYLILGPFLFGLILIIIVAVAAANLVTPR